MKTNNLVLVVIALTLMLVIVVLAPNKNSTTPVTPPAVEHPKDQPKEQPNPEVKPPPIDWIPKEIDPKNPDASEDPDDSPRRSPRRQAPPDDDSQFPDEPEPEWSKYPARRQVTHLGKVLSDIESHMPAGHIYTDSDKVTWGHETTHGINSHMRQKFGGTGKINAFYCLNDKAAVIQEPKTTIRAAASRVPQSLRGDVFNLYLVQQASSWNDVPLYICDEYVAYSNGSAVRKDLQIKDRSETVQYMMEFNAYSIALAQAIKANDPSYDDTQFKAFLKWSIKRSMNLYNQEEGASAYLERLRKGQDAEEMRAFAREYFGAGWCKRILAF